jgi:hypothetical protein
LELNDPTSAILVRPEVNIVLFGKSKKDLDSRINVLFFGGSMQERTYTHQSGETTQCEKGHEEYQKKRKDKALHTCHILTCIGH